MNTLKTVAVSLLFISTLCPAQPSAGIAGFYAPSSVIGIANTGASNLGMVFTANTSFSVVALGVYDDPKLVSAEMVGLFDHSGNLLASTTVSLSIPAVNGYLFSSIVPVALKAGNQYTVVAFFGNNPWDYGTAPITDPRITYNGHFYVDANSLQFPTAATSTGEPAGQAYYGANFLIGETNGPNTVQAPGYNISLAVGCYPSCSTGNPTSATSVILGQPAGIAIDSAGALYIATERGGVIAKVSAAGVVSIVAGGGLNTAFLGDGGPATSATLSNPQGVAVDAAGNLYIADTGNNRIRRVSTNGTILTVAGPGAAGVLGDGGPATSAYLAAPSGLTIDSAGNILVADTGNGRIRKISTDGSIATIAGNGKQPTSGGSLGDGGPATSAILYRPSAVAVDSAGNLYIADSYDYRVRKVSSTGIMTTVAGNGTSTAYYGDGGQATAGGLGSPSGGFLGNVTGLAVDASGNIYIAGSPQENGGRVRVIPSGGNIYTIAGGAAPAPILSPTTAPCCGPATDTLIWPHGVAVGSGGTLFVSDINYGSVWRLTPSAIPVTPLPSAFTAISASGFRSGVSGVPSSLALGSWIEIYGSYLAADLRTWATSDFNGINAPASLDGTSVTIGGQPAFISYISPSQINAQVPSSVGTGSQPLVITTANGSSPPYSVTVEAAAPAILSTPAFNINGHQYAVALFPDGVTYVLPTGAIPEVPSRPAKAGDTITLYGIGFGPTAPSTPAGQITQGISSLVLPLTVQFSSNGVGPSAQVTYAGLASGVVGLYQFNVTVPTLPFAPGTLITITFSLNGGAAGKSSLYLAI